MQSKTSHDYWSRHVFHCIAIGATQFVILLAVPPHSSRQLLCPSPELHSSALHSVSLHHVRSSSVCFSAWHTLAVTLSLSKCAQLPTQASCCPTKPGAVLTGFHFTAFIAPSFLQGSVHPLPSFVLLAGRPT